MAHTARKPSFADDNFPNVKSPPAWRRTALPGFFFLILLALIWLLQVPSKLNLAESAAKPAADYVSSFLNNAHKRPSPGKDSPSSSSFYEHWNWLKPFSNDKDYQSSRSVLPPLPQRCPIYVYYDQDIAASPQTVTDNEVMVVWRKAWWAAGFRPVILGTDDAMAHGQYSKVVNDEKENRMSEKMKYNIMRWLAWDHMGTGILSDFRIFPMASRNDPIMTFLRRCEFDDKITRFENLGGALYAGQGPTIASVVKNITSLSAIDKELSSPADLATDAIHIDHKPKGIAYYSKKALRDTYKDLNPQQLPQLINAHLHSHFHETFSGGIEILNAVSPATDIMALASILRAQRIAQCPESPLPQSCPPNNPSCKPCTTGLRTQLTKGIHNTTDIFTIGVIPHPYTTTSLTTGKPEFTARFIRRVGGRDVFLKHATPDLGLTVSGLYRAMKIKGIVAPSQSPVNGLWNPAEKPWNMNDMEWTLGFCLPKDIKKDKSSLMDDIGVKAKNKELLKGAKKAVYSKVEKVVQVRKAVESWNLGDFEIWKFVSSLAERRQSERTGWLDEEKRFGKGISLNE